MYIYSIPKTHLFLPNLFPRRVTLYLPLPSCGLLLSHAYGQISRGELLQRLGLSEGFYTRAKTLISLLPTLSKLYEVKCYISLEEARGRDLFYYETAKAVYLKIFQNAGVPPAPKPVAICVEDGYVVVDNYLDFLAMRKCGEWLYLATPRPTPVEEFILTGELNVEKILKFTHAVYKWGYEEATAKFY